MNCNHNYYSNVTLLMKFGCALTGAHLVHIMLFVRRPECHAVQLVTNYVYIYIEATECAHFRNAI